MSFELTYASGEEKGKGPLRFKYAFFIKHKYSIEYCKASRSYTIVNFIGYEQEAVSYRLHIIEQELNPEFFLRVHKSYIVNIYCVKKICRGKCTLILSHDEEIPFARDRKDEIINILKQVHVPEE
ncbi:MAG: LytTR family DNA-binding domain-containing protein [Bacteroidales bacterium]|jgi:DNA-binding LytR/AlgR family response regulator